MGDLDVFNVVLGAPDSGESATDAKGTKEAPRRRIWLAELALLLVGGMLVALIPAGVAMAARIDDANGSLVPTTADYPYYFATRRYHRRVNPLKYRLTYTNDPCGGGPLSLQPMRTNGNLMAPWKDWPVGQYGDNRDDLKIWKGAGNSASGWFKLRGALGTYCGYPHPRRMRFEGRITF